MATYENLISTREVSLAIEHILVAPENTAWSPARLNIPDTIPSGWQHLGAVMEDSPQLTVTKEKFQLSTGIPSVLQYQAVRGLTGQFQVTLHSNTNRIAYYGLGNYTPIKTVVGSFGNAVSITSIDAARTRVFVGTVSAASFAVGDVLSLGTDESDLTTGLAEAEVNAIGTGAALTPGWLAMSTPGFTVDATASHKVAKVSYSRIPFGTKVLPFFTVLGVADFIDGVQVVHHLGKASPAGEWTEAVRPEQNIQVATTWDLFGYSTSTYGASGTKELIVGERFWFPKQ